MKRDLDNDLFQLRLDAAALAGEVVLNKAIQECRGLTSIEDAQVRLSELERDGRWQDWITAAKRANRLVPLHDQDLAFGKNRKPNGLRLNNAAGLPKLYCYGTIGDPGLTAEDFRQELSMVS